MLHVRHTRWPVRVTITDIQKPLLLAVAPSQRWKLRQSLVVQRALLVRVMDLQMTKLPGLAEDAGLYSPSV